NAAAGGRLRGAAGRGPARPHETGGGGWRCPDIGRGVLTPVAARRSSAGVLFCRGRRRQVLGLERGQLRHQLVVRTEEGRGDHLASFVPPRLQRTETIQGTADSPSASPTIF